jgi:hypothetical protein
MGAASGDWRTRAYYLVKWNNGAASSSDRCPPSLLQAFGRREGRATRSLGAARQLAPMMFCFAECPLSSPPPASTTPSTARDVRVLASVVVVRSRAHLPLAYANAPIATGPFSGRAPTPFPQGRFQKMG